MKFKFPVFILLLSVLISCGRQNFPNEVDTGSPLQLDYDGPMFVFSANSHITDDNEIQLQVSVELFKSQLVFKSENGNQFAEIELLYEVIDMRAVNQPIVRSETETRQIKGNPRTPIQGFQSVRINRFFDTEPGHYKVRLTIKDTSSDKFVVKDVNARIPDVSAEGTRISDIYILAHVDDRSEDEFILSTYDVNADIDKLRFNFLISRQEGDDPVYVHMRLIEFESDLKPARLPTAPNLPRNSLVSRGINYENSEELIYQQRLLDTEYGPVEVDFEIDTPPPGSYRFEFFLTKKPEANSSQAETYKGRDFAVRSQNFPNIKTPREMAEPLLYLMDRKEHSRMMEIEDENELRRAVELFWVEHVGTTNLAREVMGLYYERVVEANMQFSTFKEGWKTDMGMIYILYGPPWYVFSDHRNMRWRYGYGYSSFSPSFFFTRTRQGTNRFPFDNWVLFRDISLHETNYNRIQDWLSGYVIGSTYPY